MMNDITNQFSIWQHFVSFFYERPLPHNGLMTGFALIIEQCN